MEWKATVAQKARRQLLHGMIFASTEILPKAEDGIIPCPWCKSPVGIGWSDSMKGFYAACMGGEKCHVNPRTIYHEDRQTVIDYWNRKGD